MRRKGKEYDFKVGSRVCQVLRNNQKVNPGTITSFGSISFGTVIYRHRYAHLMLDRGVKTALMLTSLVPLIENLNPNTRTL